MLLILRGKCHQIFQVWILNPTGSRRSSWKKENPTGTSSMQKKSVSYSSNPSRLFFTPRKEKQKGEKKGNNKAVLCSSLKSTKNDKEIQSYVGITVNSFLVRGLGLLCQMIKMAHPSARRPQWNALCFLCLFCQQKEKLFPVQGVVQSANT